MGKRSIQSLPKTVLFLLQKSMQHERLKRANLAPHTGVKSKESSGELSSETDIPQIFFQTEFKLEEPAVFNSVLPWSSIQGKSSVGGYKKNSSKLLQEKVKLFEKKYSFQETLILSENRISGHFLYWPGT